MRPVTFQTVPCQQQTTAALHIKQCHAEMDRKRRRGVTAAPFYLGLKAAGNYEADFAVFPQPSVRHLLRRERAITSEPFPFAFFFWRGGGDI